MKKLLYRRKQSLEKKRKIITISESANKKDYKSTVRKNFIYFVTKEIGAQPQLEAPSIDITKYINTKKKEEKFFFVVKGAFYINQGRHLFRVNFRHSLNICIQWKTKDFSPKKSATLT